MIKNHKESNISNSPQENNIRSEDHQLSESQLMDHYSPRRIPLKIPEMLRSNNTNTERENQSDETVDFEIKKDKVPSNPTNTDTKNPTDQSKQKDSSITEDELLLAASALEKLKSDKSITLKPIKLPNSNSTVIPPPIASSSTVPDPLQIPIHPKKTIFDKMISHPLISNSINYVLEKTINTSNNNIINQNSNNIITNNQPNIVSFQNTNVLNSLNKKRKREPDIIDPLDSSISNKKVRQNIKLPSLSKNNLNLNEINNNIRRKIGNDNLRQRVAISSAISAQKSLQDLKYLSGLNLNIESRKKLTMLIHFLKLGNSQLSERIDNLIQSVDKKRQKLKSKSNNFSKAIINNNANNNNNNNNNNNDANNSITTNSETRSNSEPDNNIQQIKADIVTTVKKIVNVVSKVSAQSLSEPARSNVREALLKLPTNWATMLNNESKFSMGTDDDDVFDEDDEDGDSDEGEEEGEEEDDEEEEEEIPVMTVTNQNIFKRTRKPSISRRLLTNLLRYRKTKGGEIEENTIKVKKWFREKIKDQIMNDSNGKVLILAQESLDMINKIINFCNESLDKAENWNNDRQHQHQIELLQKLQQINNTNISNIPIKDKEEVIETMVVKESNKDSTKSDKKEI